MSRSIHTTYREINNEWRRYNYSNEEKRMIKLKDLSTQLLKKSLIKKKVKSQRKRENIEQIVEEQNRFPIKILDQVKSILGMCCWVRSIPVIFQIISNAKTMAIRTSS